MKKIAVVMMLASVNCFSADANAPNLSSLERLCKAEGNKMPTLAKCLNAKLEKYQPGWQNTDEDAAPVKWYLEFLATVGSRVKRGEISNAYGEKLAAEEFTSLISRKQQQAAAARKQLDDERKLEREKQEQANWWQEYQRKTIADAQQRADAERAAKAQEERERAQRNAAILEMGVQMMNSSRTPNPAQAPRMQTCTYDRFQGMVIQNCQ